MATDERKRHKLVIRLHRSDVYRLQYQQNHAPHHKSWIGTVVFYLLVTLISLLQYAYCFWGGWWAFGLWWKTWFYRWTVQRIQWQ